MPRYSPTDKDSLTVHLQGSAHDSVVKDSLTTGSDFDKAIQQLPPPPKRKKKGGRK